MQYEQFQLNLMKEEGAIDRIYQKVAENETGDSRDVMALFETSDFEVDVNFAMICILMVQLKMLGNGRCHSC